MPPPYRQELFTLEAGGSDYPVMLSRASASSAGLKVEASSGTHTAADDRWGRYRYFEKHESELGASVKLSAQVQRADKWLQIDRAVFRAENFTTYGAYSEDRQLTLEGTVHR